MKIFFKKENIFRWKYFSKKKIFSGVWWHFKKYFEKYFLVFGCVLENTIENTFSLCCSHFLTFSQLPNKYIISFLNRETQRKQNPKKKIHQIRSNWEKKEERERGDWVRSRGKISRRRRRRDRTTKVRSCGVGVDLCLIGAVLWSTRPVRSAQCCDRRN